MIKYWKSENGRMVYDTVSGAILKLNSLEYKMISALVLPLSPICPSSLRYELAKYDSADVEEAYEKIYAMSCQGILYAPDANETLSCYAVRIGGTYGLTDMAIAVEVKTLLGGKKPTLRCESDALPDIVALFS